MIERSVGIVSTMIHCCINIYNKNERFGKKIEKEMKIHANSSFFLHAYRVIELYTLFFYFGISAFKC